MPTEPLPLQAGEDGAQLANMVAGKPYAAGDPYLCRLRDHGANVIADVNAERDMGKRMVLLKKFVNYTEGDRKRFYVAAPFTCEYGFNVIVGDDIFIGPGATFLDVCPIRIGDRTMIGANCSIFTPQHPLLPEERDGLNGAEWAAPITVGDDVWIGGNVTILPGVTIGNGSTVGAGAVVTKNVPERVVVVGNPAKVVKELPPPKDK